MGPEDGMRRTLLLSLIMRSNSYEFEYRGRR
jgi:hypothetical protein